jgi:tellurite resistance protein TehA-like permease
MPLDSPEPRSSPIENFFPGYFALVMATGIVSLASFMLGIPVIPELLFGLNLIFYFALWAITLTRLFRYRSAFLFDLTHHARGATFLTMVAATSLIGLQFANLGRHLVLDSRSGLVVCVDVHIFHCDHGHGAEALSGDRD